MFTYRYNSNGDAVIPIYDYEIEAGFEDAVNIGTVVKLNANGKVEPAKSTDTDILGVSVGPNFEGLCEPNKNVKVCTSTSAVYEASYVGAGALKVGAKFGITNNSEVDTANTTSPHVKVMKVVDGKPYVSLIATQI